MTLRRACLAFVGLLAALVLLGGNGAAEVRAHDEDGFAAVPIVSGLAVARDFAFAPDGRIFIGQTNGIVVIYKNGALLPQPFVQIPLVQGGDRGLQGLTLDPEFDENGYVYIFYTYDSDPADPSGPKTSQVVRVTADGDQAIPGSEFVVLGSQPGSPGSPSCDDQPLGADCIPADGVSHFGGDLEFAADGKLIVSTGDASYQAQNYNERVIRPQLLDSLAGKLLRINPDGTAPPDNPFYTGDPTDNRSKVWAYGLRQPFRFTLQPGTEIPFIGEVGGWTWEEVNVAGLPGLNFGWPCYEGTAQFMSSLPICQQLYASGEPVEDPLYKYRRNGGAAVIGGVFYEGNAGYPSELEGSYFFADWVRFSMSHFHVTHSSASDYEVVPDSLGELTAEIGAPINIELGPDGNIYFSTFYPPDDIGTIWRLDFTSNPPPTARASASPPGGLAPLSVQFTGSESSDPNDEILEYDWDFGDGGSSTDADPSHQYAANGTYVAQLTVRDDEGAESQAQVTVIVGSLPPSAQILTPPDDDSYSAFETVPFQGMGTDPETGPIPGAGLEWTIVLHHCIPQTASCHTHPYSAASGAGGTVIGPDQGDEVLYLEFLLTVTDSAGLKDTASAKAGPDTDGDRLPDFKELLVYGTDYLDPDTDGGGASDFLEVLLSDPFDPGDDVALLAADSDGDGCSNQHEIGSNAQLGGLRDPTNAWDFFDPDGNREVDLFGDIFAVAAAFGLTAADPGYSAALDRSPQGPGSPWAGPPDGTIDLFGDIVGVAAQFGHTCAAAP